MDSNEFPLPMEDRKESLVPISPPIQQKRGLTAKLRQTISLSAKRNQTNEKRRTSIPNLSKLTSECQDLILHAVEAIRNEDSKQVMSVLDESRNLLRSSYDDFKHDQEEYRKQLEVVTLSKEAAMQRRKENAIPLSMFMRQKRDIEGLADLRPNSGMNPTYQAYFEALLVPNENSNQHPSDKAAVIKYIRRRERRRRAEENRKNNPITDEILERKTTEILEKIDGIDTKIEHERQRQNNLIRTKMNEKKVQSKNLFEASEIIDQANEANLARERVEQKHRDKVVARVHEVRTRTPTNMIHVQPRDDNNETQLDDLQRSETLNSIQLLNENHGHKSPRPTTPIYGAEDTTNEQLANIHI